MPQLTLDGFRISENLHDGRRSRVWRAVRLSDGLPVVLKHLIVAHPSHTELTRYHYAKEVTDQLAIEGVAANLELVNVDGRPVLVGQDIGGHSLAQLRAREVPRGQLVQAIASAAETLGQVHAAGVIHRDVNPSNIVLEPESGRTQLIDFELASLLPRQLVAAAPATQLEGTLAYISPEQTGRTGRPVDNRSDLYSLGVSLFEVLTGRLPFEGHDRLGLVHAHLAEPPPNPRSIDETVPVALADIVLRLLEKEPRDRYQSGFAVARDLRHALALMANWRGHETFALAQGDAPPWLQFGRQLFGRAEETEALAAAFERAASGPTELVLVAGYSGVGKSSLVMGLRGAVGRARGRVVEGKYDQLTNVPFAAWTQVIQRLVRDLLAEPERVLVAVRARALAAVEGLGKVVIDLVPEVELLLGAQPPVAALTASEERNRFQQVLVRFLLAFATDENPLVLFLDDLQWADRPSLLLLERLVADPSGQHLLVLGAYRDNEVPEGHPLLRSVSKLVEVGASLTTLQLGPLAADATQELVASAVHMPPEDCAPLARLAHQKTGGNPFFAERFLMTLAEEGALVQVDGRWTWDLDQIEAMGLSEQVADLMARRIARLDPAVRDTLRVAAAIGGRFGLPLLAAVLGSTPQAVAEDLWPALRERVIAPFEGDYRYASLGDPASLAEHPDALRVVYRFEHDRIQEAAYALNEEADRPALHLSIGASLLASGPVEDDQIFAVTTQMNQGRSALRDDGLRRRLLELNAEAGRRALSGAAYPAALAFLQVADELLGAAAWQTDYVLWQASTLGRGKAAWMCGDFELARAAYDQAITHGRAVEDRVRAHLEKMTAVGVIGDHAEANELGLAALEELGLERPADEAGWGALGAEEGARLMAALGQGGIAGLADRPPLEDPRIELETLVLAKLIGTSATQPHIYGVVVTRLVRLFAEHGLGSKAAQGFASIGLLNSFMRDYDTAEAFGRVALTLSEQPRFAPTRAAVLMMYSIWICHWKRPYAEASELAREAVDAGTASGAFEWAGWTAMNQPNLWLSEGLELGRAITRTREVIATSRNVLQFDDAAWIATGGLHAMLRLTGDHDQIAALDARGDDEAALHERLAHYPMMRAPMYTDRLLAAVILGEREVADECVVQGKPIQLYGAGICHVPDFTFLEALHTLDTAGDRLDDVRELIDAALSQLRMWAEHCPQNHASKLTLLEAELAVREGGDVLVLFERAAEAARDGGTVHLEALCLERAGRWLLGRGLVRAARGYLVDARLAYLQWGAVAKVAQLDAAYPRLFERSHATTTHDSTVSSSGATTSSSTGDLDADALLQATTAIRTELRLEALLGGVMGTMLQAAGAERGCLLLPRDDELQLAARAESATDIVTFPDPGGTTPYSDAIVRYVLRTRQQVVIGDAARDRRFRANPYVTHRSPQSVLCQPVVKQNELIAVLYLENNLAADSFTDARCRMLSVLSTQAAVSLENSMLFEEQRQLNDAMRRFLPQAFLDTLGRQRVTDIELGDAVVRDMTVMFTDIQSFTSVSEQMGPAEIFAYLNLYLGRAGPVIKAHGGFIDKYIGDAIMAIFPTADAAVAAGLELLAEVDRHNINLVDRGLPTMSIGVGAHSGKLILGTIGEPQRMDGTVISDVVNMASRLEGLTKREGTGFIISGETAERLTRRPHLRRLGSEQLRGRQGETELFAVEAPAQG